MTDSHATLPNPLPTRINIGCGYDVRAGYLNVDLQPKHNPDLVADATHLPMLPSGYFEEILAQDVLEHLERDRTEPALAEWARLLAPEGVLQLRVPSLFGMFELLSMPHYREFSKAKEIVHLMYGTQAYTGDYHLTGFTAALLDGYLRNAGFLVCEAAIKDIWLFDVRARKTERLRDDAEFLHSAYFSVLGRPADAAGLEAKSRALASGAATRESIEDSIRHSEEARFLAQNPAYLLPYAHRLDKPSIAARGEHALRSIVRSVKRRLAR